MRKKLLHYLIVIILIVTLTGFDLLLMGHRMILAIYEEGSVAFDVYFKNEKAIISQTENLSINISIKGLGILENGRIEVKDSNFIIDKDKITDERIKSVNQECNEIELNQIIGESNTIILPIKFNKDNANNLNYFEKINEIKLTGKYRQQNNIKDIEEKSKIKLMWTEQAEINLNQEIEKYINLGEEGILVQQKIVLEVVNNALPVESQELKVTVNELEGHMPLKYVILYNGKKLKENDYEIDEENKTVNINYMQNNDNINWENGINEYKIIYTYSKDIGYQKRKIKLEISANVKLYTNDKIEKNETKEQEIDLTGKIITLNKETTPYIYKGYMYANVEDEENYEEKITMEISNVAANEKLTLTENNVFADEKNIKYETKAQVKFQQIKINKENMINILGENGNIQLQKDDGTIVNIMDSNSETDENGNIIYSFDNGIENLKIITTETKEEGNLEIYIQKSISGKTGYTKQQLKSFIKLEDTTKVESEIETQINSKNIELRDTRTEAGLEVNNAEWSTLQENTNVQIAVTLKSNSSEYDLWKNPYLYLKLPDSIDHIKVNSITPFNNNNFRCKVAQLSEEEKIIKIELEGEQLEYRNSINNEMQLIINCDITMSKAVASRN